MCVNSVENKRLKMLEAHGTHKPKHRLSLKAEKDWFFAN